MPCSEALLVFHKEVKVIFAGVEEVPPGEAACCHLAIGRKCAFLNSSRFRRTDVRNVFQRCGNPDVVVDTLCLF